MQFGAIDERGTPNSREELDHETGCFNVVCVNAKGSGSGGSTDYDWKFQAKRRITSRISFSGLNCSLVSLGVKALYFS